MTRRLWCALACCLALVSCGGGGGGGGSCSGTIVYDSYGYGLGNTPYEGEIDVAVDLSLAAHVLTGSCTPGHEISAGSLPPGLSFNAANGRISGTPTAGGEYSITVRPQVTNPDVSTTLTLQIQPLGRQPAAMSASEVSVPGSFARRIAPAIAAAADGPRMQLWLAGYDTAASRLRVLHSSDGGGSWAADSAASALIRTTGDTIGQGQFPMLAVAGRLLVLEAGAEQGFTPRPSTLWRFDGTSWAVRNASLPFRAQRGATLSRRADGSVLVLWQEPEGLTAWASADEGLTWQEVASPGGTTPGPGQAPSDTYACGGAAGADVVAVANNGSWEMNRVGAGQAQWSRPAIWPWSRSNEPTTVCASDGNRVWQIGVHAASGELSVSNIEVAETTFAFPRRIASMPTTESQFYFDALAAANGSLYGLVANPNGHTRYELWRLR